MGKGKSKDNTFLRILAVLAGVLGAGWLFANGWQDVITYILNYKFSQNFFDYFFLSADLFPVTELFVAVLFFIVIIKDLEALKDGFSLFVIIVSAISLAINIIVFIRSIEKIGDLVGSAALLSLAKIVFLLAYMFFALHTFKKGIPGNVCWAVTIFAFVFFLSASLYCFIDKNNSLESSGFVFLIFTALSNLGMLYCGSKKH